MPGLAPSNSPSPHGADGANSTHAGAAVFDPRTHAPEVLYLALPASDVCNYRCRHCHIWLQHARPNPLPRRRRLELVAEFARLSPRGTVVLPGGEVTLEIEELLAVAGECRRHDLRLIVLTNGSRVSDSAAAVRLVGSGISSIVVSLDGATAELHDYTRGVPGAFAATTRAVRLLAAARDAGPTDFHVATACVLFKENLAGFPDFVALSRSLGAQNADFQLLARTFANASRDRDVFFEKHFWHAPEEKQAAREQLAALVARYGNDPFVVKSAADLPWMLAYVDDPDFRTERPVCGSHQRNVYVDAEGNAALCFNTAAILAEPWVGNARTASLAELWTGAKATADRVVMDGCTLNCGALNCHRRKVETS